MKKYQTHGFEQQNFLTVPQENVPVYAWMWNAPIEQQEVHRQLDDMAERGIRCIYIIPLPPEFRPYTMITNLQPEYLTEDYFAVLKEALDYAKAKGISAWFYDEGGWPSGLACGKVVKDHPELRSKNLELREVTLQAGQKLDCSLQPDDSYAVAAYANGERVPLSYTATREETLRVAYVVRSPHADLLNSDSVQRFITITHEGHAKAYGNKLADIGSAFFTDEPAIPRQPYLDPAAFQKQYGYDYLDFLPEIMEAEDSPHRVDYADCYSKLAAERYYLPLQSFCHAHNMFATGHIDNDHDPAFYVGQGGHILRHLRCFDIPGIDVIWQQIRFDGTSGDMMFPHFASSAANQTGSIYSMTESFGVYGNGLTYEQMRYLIYFQAVRGINIYNPMVMSYGNTRVLALIERPSFRGELPAMFALPAMNDFMGRVSYVTSYGVPAIEACVFYPIRNIWQYRKENSNNLADRFTYLAAGLDAALTPYDVIDGDFLLQCSCDKDEKGAYLAMGLGCYRAVYMPQGALLTASEQQVLDRFVRLGGKIYYDINDNYAAIKTIGEHTGLRLTKRTGEDGAMYLIYNESASPVTETLILSDPGQYTYRLNLQNGEVYPADKTAKLSLASGEGLALLCTDRLLNTAEPIVCGVVTHTLQSETVQKVSEFLITEQGIRKKIYPADSAEILHTATGDFAEIFGSDFSGDAVYTLPIPARSKPCILDLGRVEQCCEVLLGDTSLGVLALPPYRYLLPSGNATTLRIKVGSTGAAQIIAFDSAKHFEPKYVGPYQEMTLKFEQQSCFGGLFGPITLREIH